ncbi:uncharacterized protein C1orf112-like, partial [Mercenaria mercenaria]|uniref:uncharacterized protein C1orf112-like n=1 Tax=Mercenaria mercenaria TaxID=6596 RepID=UPI00234F3F99
IQSHLQDAAVLQEEIGILKIICVSFLPWIQIEEAEHLVFADISFKGCSVLDKVLGEIKSLPKHSAAHGDLLALLEVLVELLDCFTQCIKFAQGAGNSHELASVHSLPYGAIYLLKGTYTHCKDSSEIYGDALASVTEPLSVLFKKAHALQLALLGLLDSIVINSSVSQQDIEDLCYVCQGLFEVCQIVSSLDVKLVVSLWKAVSRLSGRHKNQLKDGLDVDTMVTYLCTEINKGYMYLLQLAPPCEDKQELSLSQGDSAAFQKSLKVLGYQLRVIISLLDSFIDTVSDCVKSAYDMILAIFRSLPPSITVVNIAVASIDEIRRHLVNGIEPLVNLLVQNRTFVTFILTQDSECKPEDRLARLELLLKIADCVLKQTDDVFQSWMRSLNDSATRSIFEQIFLATSQCYIEMCMLLTVRTTEEVLLYEYICTHVCGLVGSLPAKYFCVLEECLLKHLFSVNVYVSSLAEDVWCFTARFGSAELCYQHAKLLVEVCEMAAYPYSIVKLVKRLIKFLAPDHQNQLLKCYPPDHDHVRLWSDIFVPVLPSAVSNEAWTSLLKLTVEDVQNFISARNKTYADLVDLIQSLKFLKQLLYHHGNTPVDLQSQHSAVVKETAAQLLSLLDREWTRETILSAYLLQLTELSGLLISNLENEDFLRIFDLLLNHVKTDSVKIAACHFLKGCKKVKFAPDSKQPMILKKIPMLYSLLLQDNNALLQHTALESFTQFAESTSYETLVPECLGDNQQLQNKVVAFLSKTAEVSPDFRELTYLIQQHEKLCQQHDSIDYQVIDGLQASDKLREITKEANGDMLDDIEEPALKRKRCQNTDEEDCNLLSVIVDLEKNVCSLEQAIVSGTLSSVYKSRLKMVSSKLLSLINKT